MPSSIHRQSIYRKVLRSGLVIHVFIWCVDCCSAAFVCILNKSCFVVQKASQSHGGLRWVTLQWRHNEHDNVSNHRRLDCSLNRLFRRRSKKKSKLRVTGLCVGNSPVTGEFPAHKGPVTRKMFPFDDVIMISPVVHSVPQNQWLHPLWRVGWNCLYISKL